jgi:hypothetical protein
MKILNKKAQGSEFIGMVMLVVILVIILLFFKVNLEREKVINTEYEIKQFKNIFITSSVTKFPYITEKGVSINELMGDYVCYRKEEVYYGPKIGQINIVEIIRRTLNQTFGPNNWKLELNESVCITSKNRLGYWLPDTTKVKCTPFSDKEYVNYEFLFPLPCKIETGKGKIYIST